MRRIPEYALERLYDAPESLVWQAWTDVDLFCQWYAPGVDIIVHKMDVKVGGECLIEMKSGGDSYFQKFEYIEVKPFERLVWVFAATDEQWNIIPSPHLEDWPVVLLSKMTLNMEVGKPLLRFSWSPFKATDAQIECFTKNRLAIDDAWEATLYGLDVLVSKLQAGDS